MTQVEDINRYLTDDRIFNKINKRFMSMDPGDMRDNNQRLNPFFDKLTDAMKKQCPLFAKTYQRIIWAGSYYKGTRFGQPEEYDLNFVINLPIKERDVEFTTDRPGFTKIRTVWRDKNLHNTLNIDPKAYKELNSFIDDQSYLDQEKFRRWIKRIFSKVANATGKNNRIILDGYEPISIRESGPAFTLMFQLSGRTIDIDVVPVLVFSTNTLPPRCSKMHLLQSPSNKVRCWSAVPKPLNNSRGGFGDSRNRYWRLCFYEFEKDMLNSHNYGRMKPIIRQLKKLRDTQRWNSIASYFLETLCYHESEMFHITNKKSSTFFFFTVLY
ncbi:PREDICTED: cyclic GMP-AMP synthase-like isoform X2 [Wasmannia auropunctata]|uniref:cyclic GMP-AMP synthase-like isoform X2 n=1 Tax=Wasmannia auropunctata TaxID=64793 RepID=UPI0005EEE1F0|nr:PREDICTED: cyclic GMP-AMP synthase-like isoform X2 [Wasmannia auropunctata]